MKEYVLLTSDRIGEDEDLLNWLGEASEFAGSLPPKKPKCPKQQNDRGKYPPTYSEPAAPTVDAHAPIAISPPSTLKYDPVTNDALSLARNNTMFATSSA